MTVRNQIIDVFRGDTKIIFVALTAADGTPYDPSVPGIGVEWRLATSPNAAEADALVRKSLGNGITAEDDGVNVELNAADTDRRPGLYYHEMKVLDGSDAAVVMTGYCLIRRALHMGQQATPSAGDVAVDSNPPDVT